MDSLSPQVVFAAKLPILNPNEFDLWKMRIEQYFLMTDYSLWEVILIRDYPVPTRVVKDAKTLMEAIEKRFGGNTETKKVQKTLLKQQYQNFTGSSSESLDQIHDKPQKLVSQLEIHSPQLDNEDLKQIDVDDLKEMDLRWQMAMLTMRARRKGHFARECRSPKDSRRPGVAEPQKRIIPVETSTSNALVSQYDGTESYDWSYQADEEPANYALMAFSSSSSDNEFSSGSNCESCPPSSLYDRFQPSGGYHVVPPPYTGTFMPPKPDLVFTTAPTDVETDHLAFNVQLSPPKFNQYLSHTTRPTAPIIEDWVSDSKDESKTKAPLFVPSFVQSSKQMKSPMRYVQPDETSIPAAATTTHTSASPKSASSSKRKNRKACFVCKCVDHLIKDCYYHAKKMAQPTLRNYAHRVVSAAQGMKGKWSNQQHALKDKGVIDSGCSRHMTWNMSYLSDFEELNGGYVAFRGNPKGGKIFGKGKIKTDSLLPIPFWAEAVNTACYVQNRVLVTKPHNKTPYKLLHGRTPSIGFMRHFGCRVTILNTLDPLGKFEGKVDEGFLVGYFVSSKAFRVVNSRTRIVQETLHVNFLENKPNVAVSGPTWLFDIDSLTRTMNYQPVIAGNQTNPSADLSVEFEDCSDNSSNAVNAAGTIVLLLGKIPLIALTPLVMLNDLDMPELEDITYSNDEDVVGAEADFNNLENSITVSPIPTTRIHKDHRVSQIIGDLSLTTQTRSMTRVVKDQGGLSQMFNNNSHTCMFACFLSQEEPKRVHQALKDPSWIKAMQEELLQFKMQKVWVLVDLSHGKRAVARIKAIRLFLAYASFMGFMVYQMDIKSAFLYGTIEEEVYVCQPLGFEDPDKVYKVVKVLYGLHQAPRACQDKYVADILRKFRLTEGKSASTPIDTEKPLLKDPDGEDVDVHTYSKVTIAATVWWCFGVVAALWCYRWWGHVIASEVKDLIDLRFEDLDHPDKVYKVVKALYGLHQAPRAWYETLANYLLENDFQRGKIDQTLFIKKQKGDILLVQIYVDDIIFGATNKDLCKSFEKLMKDKFQMSSMGELTFFLGLQDSAAERRLMLLSQVKTVNDKCCC
nr:hypothetical protein [Tanacetum cinerariifolium]